MIRPKSMAAPPQLTDLATAPATAARREVRFGLVLYGGVSLAVYIYGVAREFERLVRASQGIETNAWTEILRETKTAATVDIVSGASAGGINGVLLGKALATGAKLSSVESLWVDEADIGGLLRETSDREPASLLRTDLFRELIDRGLEKMDESASGEPLNTAFDLFVAGTRLEPWARRFRTDLGGQVRTRDYRKSFHLKLRSSDYNPEASDAGYDRNDFLAGENAMLADIAQATSAFPAAFEPRLIEVGPANEKLFAPDEPRATHFSDGGILHNKPFTETISTIVSRAASRPVDRWLVSVEPDPEHVAPHSNEEAAPNVAEVVGKAVLGIPRYQSIAADLQRLDEHRRHAARASERLDEIDAVLLRQIGERIGDGEVREWYEETLEAFGYWQQRQRRFRSRLAELFSQPPPPGDLSPVAAIEQTEADLGGALYRNADPDFERRRVYRLLEMTRALQEMTDVHTGFPEELATARMRLWAQLDRIENLIWELFGPEADWRSARGGSRERIGPELGRLSIGLKSIRSEVGSICKALDELLPPRSAHPERFSSVFEWFELWDLQLLTIAETGDAAIRDRIRFARISPADATHIRKPTAAKLAGDSLGHFGGFLKKDWRRNDLLWGRLDAAETICRMLAAQGDRPDTQELEPLIEAVQKEIVEAEVPDLDGDYRAYMEREHRVGEEGLRDVPMEDRADLSLRSASVLRNMMRGLGNADGLPGPLQAASRWIGGGLAFLLGLLRWPILASFGRDAGVRRGIDIAILFVGLWSLTTFVLVLLDAVGPTSTLWSLIATGAAIFALRCLAPLFRRLLGG